MWLPIGTLFLFLLICLMQETPKIGCSTLIAGDAEQREKRKWASYLAFGGKFGKNAIEGFLILKSSLIAGWQT
jgi:hypothetical protein